MIDLNVKFIFVVGYQTSIVLDSKDKFILEEIDEVGAILDDWLIDDLPLQEGLYLWEGQVSLVDYGDGRPEPEYKGSYKMLYDYVRDSYTIDLGKQE